MMDRNPNIERAAQVLRELDAEVFHGFISQVQALDAAGLLATTLMQRAVEACEEADRYASKGYILHKAFARCAEVGSESLSAKAAAKRERFVCQQRGQTRYWDVHDTSSDPDNPYAHNLTESQARAVAAALNQEAAK